MSAISDAKNAAPKVAKTFKDIYNGGATVKEVTALEPRFTDGLSEEEAANAFDIQLIVTPDDASIPEQEITIACSARHPKFAPEKTEGEVAVEELTRHGLVTGGDISTVFASVGKPCQINAYEETSAKGTFARCRLSRNNKVRVPQSEIMKRIAAMTGRAPAAQAQNANPFG